MNRLQSPPCEAPSGGFGVIFRAESDGGDETGRRAHWRRFSRGSGGAEPPGKTQCDQPLK
eukprot:619975-Alexandrium_andersonii.AAC.1